MDIFAVKTFFMWCTIINLLLLILSFLICAFAGDWIYGNHSRWFRIPRETFNTAIYSFLGLYKILVLVFNIVPWIALIIVG